MVVETNKGYKQTDIGLLPGDWKAIRLGDIANIRRGASPRPINDPKWFADSGRGWIRISDVTNSKIYLKETTQYLSESGERCSVKVDKGDLIMSICATIGMPIIIDIPACIHDGFVLFEGYKDKIETYYLYYYLESIRELLSEKGQPGTQKNLNTTIVNDIIIPMPPTKEEQSAIATILSDTDALITSLEKLIVKKQAIKQGSMQELLKPKDGWKVKLLGEVMDFSNGKAHEQFINDNGKYIVVNSKFISTEGYVVKYSNQNICPLFKSDITIVMSDIPNGKALAKCYLIDADNKYTLNQRIGSVRPKEGDSKYYFYQINRNKYFLEFDSGAGQTNLRKEDILKCPIFMPQTLSEQTHIASILTDIDAEIEILERKLDKTRLLKQGMMQELLTGKTRLVKNG